MPSRRKEKRSCVKIRLLFWNTSCCLSISYFYTGILALTAWVKVSGSSHAKRITSGWMEKKERETDSVPFPLVPFVFNSKSSSNSTMNTSFMQEISEVTVNQRGTWTYSPYCSKISNSNQWAFTLLWRDGRRCQANSLQCNHSPEREQWAEHLESNWFLQSTTTQSERPYIWVVSSLHDLQTLCPIMVSVSGSGGIPGFASNLL